MRFIAVQPVASAVAVASVILLGRFVAEVVSREQGTSSLALVAGVGCFFSHHLGFYFRSHQSLSPLFVGGVAVTFMVVVRRSVGEFGKNIFPTCRQIYLAMPTVLEKKGKTVHLQPPLIFDFFNPSPEFRLFKRMSLLRVVS